MAASCGRNTRSVLYRLFLDRSVTSFTLAVDKSSAVTPVESFARDFRCGVADVRLTAGRLTDDLKEAGQSPADNGRLRTDSKLEVQLRSILLLLTSLII